MGGTGTLHRAGHQVLQSAQQSLNTVLNQSSVFFLNQEFENGWGNIFLTANNEFSDILAHEKSFSSPEKADILSILKKEVEGLIESVRLNLIIRRKQW